ncbi:hypothetical protein KIPB_012273 [Kipferlia bialata]|uniref:NADH:flavin oxidoreductase/NADH oxidase N-terminal domain-containing protein n=1 Tax=Kipferlia bialata TaxID=797122 RepID=A0A9K3D5Y1_9EUKA|nr:hypothetical protein KIPB_012273 [Kipferlia bialata]|eukprot:g12273.t1
MNVTDGVEDSMTPEMAVAAASAIHPMISIMEVSGGIQDRVCKLGTARTGKAQGFYYEKEARLIREAVGQDIILTGTGGFRTQEHIEAQLKPQGVLDMVAPGRPFLRNPSWLCDLEDSGAPSKCINCNGCFRWFAAPETSARGTCIVREKLRALGKE